jgi:hypothetical protein
VSARATLALEHIDVTDLEKLAAWYVVWMVISGCPLWILARWTSRRPHLHTPLLLAAATIIVICVGLVVYALGESSGPLRSHLKPLLSGRWVDNLLLFFVAWPFAACIAVAGASRWLSLAPVVTRWLSFTAGMLIAVLCPFALLVAGCGLAGACL